MTPLLELTAIAKHFVLPSGERLEILRGLDLAVAPGEIVAIVGRSGSGKSTLLNILGLLDTPSAGTVRCNGHDVAKLGDGGRCRLRGEFLGFIFQHFYLLERRSALENAAEPLFYAGRRELAQRYQLALAALDRVGLADRAGSTPNMLSGGEQQRVAIARALIRRPRVILADEPTGALDEVTGEIVLKLLLQRVREDGVSLIIVTHERAVARQADRVLTLAEGTLQVGMA